MFEITLAPGAWSRFSQRADLKRQEEWQVPAAFLSICICSHLHLASLVLHSLLFCTYQNSFYFSMCPCSFLKMRVTWRSLPWKICPRTWTRDRNQSPCSTQSSWRRLMPVFGALADPGSLAGDPAQVLLEGGSLVTYLGHLGAHIPSGEAAGLFLSLATFREKQSRGQV